MAQARALGDLLLQGHRGREGGALVAACSWGVAPLGLAPQPCLTSKTFSCIGRHGWARGRRGQGSALPTLLGPPWGQPAPSVGPALQCFHGLLCCLTSAA